MDKNDEPLRFKDVISKQFNIQTDHEESRDTLGINESIDS